MTDVIATDMAGGINLTLADGGMSKVTTIKSILPAQWDVESKTTGEKYTYVGVYVNLDGYQKPVKLTLARYDDGKIKQTCGVGYWLSALEELDVKTHKNLNVRSPDFNSLALIGLPIKVDWAICGEGEFATNILLPVELYETVDAKEYLSKIEYNKAEFTKPKPNTVVDAPAPAASTGIDSPAVTAMISAIPPGGLTEAELIQKWVQQGAVAHIDVFLNNKAALVTAGKLKFTNNKYEVAPVTQ